MKKVVLRGCNYMQPRLDNKTSLEDDDTTR